MVELYFPKNTVMVTGYGFDMLYAGVGDYYGGFDAQTVFDTEVPKGALLTEIFRADNTAYSKKLNKAIMMRDGRTTPRKTGSRSRAPRSARCSPRASSKRGLICFLTRKTKLPQVPHL